MSRFDERAKDWDKKQTTLDKSDACINHLKEKIDFSNIKNILDYGCGTGLIAFNLVEKNNEVLGLDNSYGMIEEFNKKVKEKNLSNIKAKKHNILEEDLPKNSFDLIVISMSLHHIEDIDMFFKKSFEALKNGGYICVNDLDKEDGSFHAKHNNEGVYHFGFSKDELVETAKKIGFSDSSFDIVYIFERENGNFPIFNFIAKKA
ncbi:class I SAM-dependent methyltransferase [Aliarcobacter butzleri]|uniref:Class I SAM-dependent methyltransferase n=1 Tax=Aliarcobacter butzleri TaxID=28197 RepID=A0AAP4UN04_9BACT|nr:class I SAM-dependent methyltransferase [Aliarcobacter butzleri]MCG3701040.1 class I SAM-dependent methyltransferase [Aliarcobacter butzleri]MDN5051104.1 class I SAM-dependent methyltransferase [Aliarcobacter butzleri]MDN5061925.1 class I SAM-dependent methyltransferase [Aliarcobacter butzleri]MDN5074430.1 class I SAM-dependent methyltransferase [Aliarcobacter butzleri]MDN5115596.1 class I SAM-dependent methyltransferase [Aliarcobacter butzleri]